MFVVIPNIAPADPENSVFSRCDVFNFLDWVNIVQKLRVVAIYSVVKELPWPLNMIFNHERDDN